jgi:hypothetical protein
MDFSGERTAYDVLGLEAGPECTPDAIKKVGSPSPGKRAVRPRLRPRGARCARAARARGLRTGRRGRHGGMVQRGPHASGARAPPALLPAPPRPAASHPPPRTAQAYRRLALIKHPDKAKTPNAAEEFAELQRAYSVLSDPSARAALDDYLRWAASTAAGRLPDRLETLQPLERTDGDFAPRLLFMTCSTQPLPPPPVPWPQRQGGARRKACAAGQQAAQDAGGP